IDRVDRLDRQRAWDANVAEEHTGRRVGNDGALVTGDEVVEVGFVEVRTDGPEHAAGDDDHVDTGDANARDRRARMGAQHRVRPDQGAVEVDRERGDMLRKARREPDYGGVPPVDFTT